MGLANPGVHGAPDPSGAAHRGMHTGVMPNGDGHTVAVAEALSYPYGQSQPGVMSSDNRMYKQTRPAVSESPLALGHGARAQARGEYTDEGLRLPRGHAVINRKPTFEEVKHVAPPTLAEAPSRSNLVSRASQGRNEPLSFVYNERDLVVDEPVPNRRGVSLNGLPPPWRRGHGAFLRALTGYGRGRFTHKDRVRAMMTTRRGPALGKLMRIRRPDLNVKGFFQGNPLIRHMTKTKIRSG